MHYKFLASVSGYHLQSGVRSMAKSHTFRYWAHPLVILNSPTVVRELFENRGAIYSNRPRLPMAGELVGYNMSVPLAAYGPHHTESRKLMQSSIGGKRVDSLNANFFDHIRRHVASIVLHASHGYNVLSKRKRSSCGFSEPSHVRILASKYSRNVPSGRLSDTQANGTAEPSFTEALIRQNPNPSKEQDLVHRWASVAFYSGGADTTVSAISSIFLSMALFPDVQAKVQAELDKVVGTNRLPSFADRDHLPYLANVLKEILRWNPVAPLALPHSSIQDDIYNGYFIPRGSLVMANSWWLMHNPQIYPLPEKFDPDRYDSGSEGSEGSGVGMNPDPHMFAFGYGRRICPGNALADASLFITVAAVLSIFQISNPYDMNGKQIKENFSYTVRGY
ncbi:cytochrome P450 [Gymnopus androsaceus JB14]|uniref:Cytochrome P450 n=1 Tax=Gymnopus androsaceus JB14 TaxID=1447944 RepID=A0A6A4HN43_9AGAR|nr:cytochrome P450 [Gymnopus androsaceus JB14]